MTEHGHSQGHGPGGGYERRDLSIKAIILFAIALALLIPITSGLMGWLLKSVRTSQRVNDQPLSPLIEPGSEPPWKKVSTTEREIEQLEELHQASEARLHSYSWFFKPATAGGAGGVGRIPIDKAKEILIQRGLPAREQPGG